MIAAPVYLVLILAGRAAGADAGGLPVVNLNAHVTAFWVSGLPGLLLVLLLHAHFRRQGSVPRSALLLAAGFGLGTLVLPYAGLFMNHNMAAACLFGAWLLLAGRDPSPRATILAGLLLGTGAFVEYLIGPLVPLFLVWVVWRTRDWRRGALLMAGPALALAAILAMNAATFGRPFTTSYAFQAGQFRGSGLLLGVFHAPEWMRLWWLTLHPHRGLFYCCPVLLLGAIGAAKGAADGWSRRWRSEPDGLPETAPPAVGLFPLVVCGYFLAFNLCFNAWTGGWGVGPRYLMPALPFLYAYAHHAFAWLPRFSAGLMAVSAAFMLAVAASGTMIPAANFGPPARLDPVAWSFAHLKTGRVSVSTQSMLDRTPNPQPGALDLPGEFWDSYNLGEVAGLRGLVSLLPVLAAIVLFYAAALLPPRPANRAARGPVPPAVTGGPAGEAG